MPASAASLDRPPCAEGAAAGACSLGEQAPGATVATSQFNAGVKGGDGLPEVSPPGLSNSSVGTSNRGWRGSSGRPSPTDYSDQYLAPPRSKTRARGGRQGTPPVTIATLLDDIAALKPIAAEPPMHELLKSLEPITWSAIAPKFEVFGEARRPARKQNTTPAASSAPGSSQPASSPSGMLSTESRVSHKEELELPGWAAAGLGRAVPKDEGAADAVVHPGATTAKITAPKGNVCEAAALGGGGDELDDAQLLALHEAQLDLMRRDWKAKQEVKERRRNRQQRTPSTSGGPGNARRKRDRKR